MKLALDIWYEAWGRTGGEDAALLAAGSGEVAGAPEAVVPEGPGRDGGGHRGTRENAEDAGLPPGP